MSTKDFYKIVENPKGLSQKDVDLLDSILKEHPYFASAHLLKILDQIHKKDAEVIHSITNSSLYIQDKSKLYDNFNKLLPELKNIDNTEENKVEENELIDQKDVIRITLPGNAIELKDFTNEILDEISVIGKGMRDTIIESFENSPELINEVKAPSTKAEILPIASSNSANNNLEKDKEDSDEKSSESRGVADEVMESIAKMRKEREENRKHLEEALKKSDVHFPPKSGAEKNEKKSPPSFKEKDNKKADKTVSKKSADKVKVSKKAAVVAKSDKLKPNKTLSKTKSIGTEKGTKVKSDQKLIEKFINSDVKLKPPKAGSKAENIEDLSKPSTEMPSNLVSENLANIFEKQGKVSKAITIYKQLILKYPEKKSYFAQKIENLEK